MTLGLIMVWLSFFSSLGRIRGVAAYKSSTPKLYWHDQQLLMSARSTTRPPSQLWSTGSASGDGFRYRKSKRKGKGNTAMKAAGNDRTDATTSPIPPPAVLSPIAGQSPITASTARLSSRVSVDEYRAFVKEFLECIKSREFEPAMSLYARMKQSGMVPKDGIINGLLSVCHKASHLDSALEIFDDLIAHSIPLNEPAYMVLIRCYSDGGQTTKALALMEQMKASMIEPKLRTYHPILEAECLKGDIDASLALVQRMKEDNIFIRSEQLTLILESAARSNKLHDPTYKKRIHALLNTTAQDLLGIETAEMRRVVAALCGKDLEVAVSDGILIETREDLPGPVVTPLSSSNIITNSDNDMSEGYAPQEDAAVAADLAKNQSHGSSSDSFSTPNLSSSSSLSTPSSSSSSSSSSSPLPTLSPASSSSMVVAMNTSFNNAPVAYSNMEFADPTMWNLVRNGQTRTEKESSLPSTVPDLFKIAAEDIHTQRLQRARVVDVSERTCVCPNCGDTLRPLLLDEEERKRVRVGLMKIASTSSMTQLRNIQSFLAWLKSANEYTYIVDGANVAYNRQNFHKGKFSYSQIELVVNKLLERNDGKVLVLMPYPYAQKVVPNSSKQKGKRNITFITENDQRILKRFEDERMMYVVPPGADDDWYWIMPTVVENRSNTAYVVTNDLMRDHRLAFLEPRPFIRWRTTQVMHFDFSKAAVEDEEEPPEVFFIPPGKFSKEIQQTDSGRWHFPATDRQAWLCMTTDLVE